jgi:hypothetical protein
MKKVAHKIFLGVLAAIVFITFIMLVFNGLSYYSIGLEERFYHPEHHVLKPSGLLGHGLGILGSFFIILGVSSYMARKRYRFLSRWGLLKHWLEIHIFLCTLGPIMVLFHTAFKFGGLVAVSFWSMVAVFLSGIIGRFIYIQIPRTIEGRELSLSEVREMKSNVAEIIRDSFNLDETSFGIIADSTKTKVELYHASGIVRYIRKFLDDRKSIRKIKMVLKRNRLPGSQYRKILDLVKSEILLNRRIERLETMQNLFKYWHVAHLPFALVMIVIMIIHVGVTLVFGYHWIF